MHQSAQTSVAQLVMWNMESQACSYSGKGRMMMARTAVNANGSFRALGRIHLASVVSVSLVSDDLDSEWPDRTQDLPYGQVIR